MTAVLVCPEHGKLPCPHWPWRSNRAMPCGCRHLHRGRCPVKACGCRQPHPLRDPRATAAITAIPTQPDPRRS